MDTEGESHRIRRWLIVAVGLVALAVLVLLAVRLLTPSEQRTHLRDQVPADIAAANGPLVGDPDAVAGERGCLAEKDNAPWSASMAAFEVHDSNRTHLYECATFPGSMKGENRVFAYSSATRYTTPYNIVDRGPDALFVYGGGYGDNPDASGSFVSRIAPDTFTEVWRRVLINTHVTGEWNYPGVINSLAGHGLIVIYGYHIARLDPKTGRVLARATLPTGDSKPENTAYNGYDALPDGTIIAKTVNRQPGCTEQGFSAFLKCPDPASAPASMLVAIDPATLRVKAKVKLPEMMGGRVTTTVRDGLPLIYLPGATKLYRYTYRQGKLAVDRGWGPVPYLKKGQTAASAMAVIGDRVAGMTNGGAPTPTPMSVFTVSQDDSKDVTRIEPFADADAKDSFIPSMVAVDPSNGRVYAMDAGAGRVGAIDLKPGGKLSLAWAHEQRTLSFLTLIGPQRHRVLIGTDIPLRSFKGLKRYRSEEVVWRDAASGTELARSSAFPKMTAGILVTPGYGGIQYFLSASGHVISLQVAPPAPAGG